MSDWRTEFDPKAARLRGAQARAKVVQLATQKVTNTISSREGGNGEDPVIPSLADDVIRGIPGYVLDVVHQQMAGLEYRDAITPWHRAALAWLVYEYELTSEFGRGVAGVREWCNTWPVYWDAVKQTDNSRFREDRLTFGTYFPDHVLLQHYLRDNPPRTVEEKNAIVAEWEARGMRDLRVPGVSFSSHVELRTLPSDRRTDILRRMAGGELNCAEARQERREALGKASGDPELEAATDIQRITERVQEQVEVHVEALFEVAATPQETEPIYHSVVRQAKAKGQEEHLFAAIDEAGLTQRFLEYIGRKAEFYDDRLTAESDGGRRLELNADS